MESELEKTPQDTSTGQQEEGREGYNAGGSYSRTYGNAAARTPPFLWATAQEIIATYSVPAAYRSYFPYMRAEGESS